MVLENQNGKICFWNSSQNVYVSVGCPWVWCDVHFQMLLEVSLVWCICQWKHKQHHLDLCLFLEHLWPTASNGHEVILPSWIQFLLHNLWYDLVDVYHLVGIERRMPQVYVETSINQLWGFGIGMCFCLQCSFWVHLFVLISSHTVQLQLESSQASVNQLQTMIRTMWGYLTFIALLVHHTIGLANKQMILWHFSEIYKPAHFSQVVLLLLDFVIVQLLSCALQVFYLEITRWLR